jgi:WD40 repeat protein
LDGDLHHVHTYKDEDNRPRIATAGLNTVRVFDGDDHSLLFTIECEDEITAMTGYGSGSGARLVLGCMGGSTAESVRVYDGANGGLLRSMHGHGPPPRVYECGRDARGSTMPDRGRRLTHLACTAAGDVTYILSVSDCRTYKVWEAGLYRRWRSVTAT